MAATAKTIAQLCKLKPSQVINVFRAIQRIVGRGETVTIRCFGRFERVVHRGRTQETPLVEGGSVTYGDRNLMKFRPSRDTKDRMNKVKRKREV